MYLRKRDRLVKALDHCGLKPVVPKGSYFVMADTSSIPSSAFMGKGKAEPGIGGSGPKEETRDYQFCRWLTRELGTFCLCFPRSFMMLIQRVAMISGVGAIPPSAFFSRENAQIAENYVRFTFCKQDEVLEAAADKLEQLRQFRS